MMAPAEAITIVDVRTEEDILDVLRNTKGLIAQEILLQKSDFLSKGGLVLVGDIYMESHRFFVRSGSAKKTEICRRTALIQTSTHATLNGRFQRLPSLSSLLIETVLSQVLLRRQNFSGVNKLLPWLRNH